MKKWVALLAVVVFAIACQNKGDDSNPSGAESTVAHEIDTTQIVDANVGNDSLNQYIADNPYDKDALLERAHRYLNNRNVLYAEADVRAAMEIDSLYPKALLRWGDVHFFKNETRTSRDAWLKCIEIDPDNVDCRLKLAELYTAVQNFRESLRLVNEVIELDPTQPVAFFIKGTNIRDLTGDTAQAVRYVQEAIELDPEYWAALDYAAVMLSYMKDARAEPYFKRMVELDPNSNPTYYKMGMFYLGMGESYYNQAIDAFTRATQLRPTDAESFFNMGYIHLELKVYDVALEYFNKSIQARQVNHRAYYGRGFVYERMGDVQRAMNDYRQALAYNPNHQASRVAIARLQDIMSR